MDKDARIAELETQVEALTNIFKILHPKKKDDTITKKMLEQVYRNGKSKKNIPNFSDMMKDERKLWATKVIKAGLFKVSHGDAFHWLGEGYRNENLLFWHETNGVMFPYCEIDDYGSVPPCFVVGEGFSPDHWTDMVDHNGLVFLSDKLVAEIKENLVKKEGKYGPVYTCSININDCDYVVETEGLDDG